MMVMIRSLISSLAVFGFIMLIGILSLLAFFILKFIFIALVIILIIWFILSMLYYGFKEVFEHNT